MTHGPVNCLLAEHTDIRAALHANATILLQVWKLAGMAYLSTALPHTAYAQCLYSSHSGPALRVFSSLYTMEYFFVLPK